MSGNIKIKYALEGEIDKYFQDETHMNQSFLKVYADGLEFMKEEEQAAEGLYYKENKNFILGDYIDKFLTGNENALKDKFFTEVIEKKPSEAIMSIVQYYLDNISDEAFENNPGELIRYARSIEYRTNYKDDTLLATIIKEGREYFEHLKRAQGKQIISQAEYDVILNMIKKIEDSQEIKDVMTKPWLYLGEINADPECVYEVLFQQPVYFTYQELKSKGLLDILIIKKNIFTNVCEEAAIIDLKSTGTPVFRFNEAVDKYRYDFQIAFYKQAVIEFYKIPENKINCFFFVLGKANPRYPLISFKCTNELVARGKVGNMLNSGPKAITAAFEPELKRLSRNNFYGFEEAIRSYKHYLSMEGKAIVESIDTFGTEFMLGVEGIYKS